jgi:glutathione peroxidase-family protein
MSFFAFKMKDLAGKMVNFESFKQSKCFLIVNVASQ